VGGDYTWYILPSKQTEYPDKGWDITASSNGYYKSDTKNLRFAISESYQFNGSTIADPLYQQVVEGFDFVLAKAVDVNFDFSKTYGAKGDFVIPFTTYTETGAAADMADVVATVNDEEVTVKSLGGGKYEAVFNLYSMGITGDVEFAITFGDLGYAPFSDVINTTDNAFTLSVADTTDFHGKVDYTLSLGGATNILTAEFNFEVDSNYLDFESFTPASGFEVFDEIIWTALPGGKSNVNIKLIYRAGGDSTGFTTHADAVIGKFVFGPKNMGDTYVTLKDVIVTGYDALSEEAVFLGAVINGTGKAGTLIASKYDLNKDNVIDALDLSIVLLYIGFLPTDPEWDTYVKVKDVKGGDITASICDVNGDGKIDLLDLMAVYINYFPI